MEIGRHRGMIVNAHMKIGSNSYDKVKTFKYLGCLLTNQNYIQEEKNVDLSRKFVSLFSPNTLVFFLRYLPLFSTVVPAII